MLTQFENIWAAVIPHRYSWRYRGIGKVAWSHRKISGGLG